MIPVRSLGQHAAEEIYSDEDSDFHGSADSYRSFDYIPGFKHNNSHPVSRNTPWYSILSEYSCHSFYNALGTLCVEIKLHNFLL